MSDRKDVTSAGVPWSEVPEIARHHVEWMDGRRKRASFALLTLTKTKSARHTSAMRTC
jgi:hypothetical protein